MNEAVVPSLFGSSRQHCVSTCAVFALGVVSQLPGDAKVFVPDLQEQSIKVASNSRPEQVVSYRGDRSLVFKLRPRTCSKIFESWFDPELFSN